MMIPTLTMAVMMGGAAISAAFWLEARQHRYKICPEAAEHISITRSGRMRRTRFEFPWANVDFPDAKQGA
jgi:hypothetical protein